MFKSFFLNPLEHGVELDGKRDNDTSTRPAALAFGPVYLLLDLSRRCVEEIPVINAVCFSGILCNSHGSGDGIIVAAYKGEGHGNTWIFLVVVQPCEIYRKVSVVIICENNEKEALWEIKTGGNTPRFEVLVTGKSIKLQKRRKQRGPSASTQFHAQNLGWFYDVGNHHGPN